MQYLQIEKPEEYSVERVNEIAAAVEEQDQLLADSEASQIVPKNVIVIMKLILQILKNLKILVHLKRFFQIFTVYRKYEKKDICMFRYSEAGRQIRNMRF